MTRERQGSVVMDQIVDDVTIIVTTGKKVNGIRLRDVGAQGCCQQAIGGGKLRCVGKRR